MTSGSEAAGADATGAFVSIRTSERPFSFASIIKLSVSRGEQAYRRISRCQVGFDIQTVFSATGTSTNAGAADWSMNEGKTRAKDK